MPSAEKLELTDLEMTGTIPTEILLLTTLGKSFPCL